MLISHFEKNDPDSMNRICPPVDFRVRILTVITVRNLERGNKKMIDRLKAIYCLKALTAKICGKLIVLFLRLFSSNLTFNLPFLLYFTHFASEINSQDWRSSSALIQSTYNYKMICNWVIFMHGNCIHNHFSIIFFRSFAI